MSFEGELIGEHARLKIVQALLDEDLSWTNLLKKANLSARTLSRRLEDLKEAGIVIEKEVPAEYRKKATNVYSLNKNQAKEFYALFKPLQEARAIEARAEEFEKLLFERARLYSEKDVKKVTRKYYDEISNAITEILLIELLRERKDEFRDTFISGEMVAAIQRILWQKPFVSLFAAETKEALREEIKENREKMLKIMATLKSEIAKRKQL